MTAVGQGPISYPRSTKDYIPKIALQNPFQLCCRGLGCN